MILIPHKGTVLPPGFVLDPPPESPRRNAPPQHQALVAPDYGERFLQDSLGYPADTACAPATEDPGWMDRARQGLARLRQRNSAEQALQLVDYMEGLRNPRAANERIRSALPEEPGRRRTALKNTEQLFSELVQRTAEAQRDQDAIPDSNFLQQWHRTDTTSAAKLAWEHRGAALRDFVVPAAVELAPTALKMLAGGGMIRRVGGGFGLGAQALGRSALGGAAVIAADDGYEAGVSSEMFYQLQRRGVDLADPAALESAFRNRELMAEVMKPARKAGYVSAGANAAGTAVAGRVFARSTAGPVAREATNLAVQLPAQTALGGSATAMSQKLARGEVDWKDVIATAIGSLALAPVDVATAVAGGYRQKPHGNSAENPAVPAGRAKEDGGEKQISVQEATHDGKGADDAIDDNLGAARRLSFEAADYHKDIDRGRKSRGPRNGQDALDSSVTVKDSSGRRIGVDYETGDFVVFDRTADGTYHGHVRSWDQLHIDMQNALRKAGMTDRRGHVRGISDE